MFDLHVLWGISHRLFQHWCFITTFHFINPSDFISSALLQILFLIAQGQAIYILLHGVHLFLGMIFLLPQHIASHACSECVGMIKFQHTWCPQQEGWLTTSVCEVLLWWQCIVSLKILDICLSQMILKFTCIYFYEPHFINISIECSILKIVSLWSDTAGDVVSW